MIISINTHDYDGKLDTELIGDLPTNLPVDEKVGFIQSILNDEIKNNPRALNSYNVILSGNGNYDNANKLDALDLLWLCCKHAENNKDFKEILIESLADIQFGICSQGRTTRLFQILLLKTE